MKYLITGGAGFIGSAMIRHIIKSSDNEVLNVDSLTYASNLDSLHEICESSRYFFENANISDKEEIKRIFSQYSPDFIINFAAESHVDNSIKSPFIFMQTNILGTYNLLINSFNYFNELDDQKKKTFRFLHVSTDEVYGDLEDKDDLFTEDTKYDPSSPYSASKASSDHLVRAWRRTYKLPTLITNCSNNYGPYQHSEKLIPTVIKNILSLKKIPIYGDGKNIRDWLYVQDHIEAILTVLNSSQIGETYNIGGNNQVENLELVNKICEIFDRKFPLKSSKLNKYSELISFIDDRAGHDYKYAIDASKIKKDLGWEPSESFNSGLEKTIDWYIENKLFLGIE